MLMQGGTICNRRRMDYHGRWW